ncbi:hypothetical protein NDU88_000536 [Pleurodeles waltl]|uniref:Uncharacterized protein n=1 Tax=Pleurodeles waltl TaxID=8319 RepID=A0AAV7SWY6_PLEWA|nr:hypothetical protein NDU88_000536 [Pleurodeles waltl]
MKSERVIKIASVNNADTVRIPSCSHVLNRCAGSMPRDAGRALFLMSTPCGCVPFVGTDRQLQSTGGQALLKFKTLLLTEDCIYKILHWRVRVAAIN